MAYKFFNYAQAMKDRNEIEEGRLKNQLQGLENEEARQKVEGLKKLREIRSMHKNAPARIEALKDAGMLDQANQLIQSEIETLEAGVGVAKTMRDGLNSDNWKATRQQLIQVGAIEPEFMPVNYDDKWLRARENEAKSNLKVITELSGTDEGGITATDITVRDGREVRRGEPYDPAKKTRAAGGGKGGGGITPAMSNSIGRTVAQLFDSIYDPGSGEISITDPEQRPKVLAIRTDAERYVLEGMTPAKAVERAAKDYGIKRPVANDPGNIRNFLPKE